MSFKKTIAMIGAGNMGTALANLLAKNDHEIKIWDANQNVLQEIRERHLNTLYLPNIPLSYNIVPYDDINECIKDTQFIIICVPSRFVRKTVKKCAQAITHQQVIINCTKGIEENSLKFMSEVIEEELDEKHHHRIADFSGPSIANEVAKEVMSAVVVASKNQYILPKIKELFENEYFRVIVRIDTVGVELGGVMKNIYALGMGICEGLNEGINTKAFFLDGGLHEMSRLGVAMGAYKETFYGLSGIGDLIATCMSQESRNHKLGKYIGDGKTIEEGLKLMRQTSEGYLATKTIYELSKKFDVDLPIVNQMYAILYEKKPIRKAMGEIINTFI